MNTAQEPLDEVPTFEVRILFDNSDPKLKPGMTAQERIIIEEFSDVLYVPIGTVFENAEGSPIVFTKKSYPNPLEVELGKRNEQYITIKSGISENDLVSWMPHSQDFYPLGRFAEMEFRRTEQAELLAHIESMNEQGLTYDPDTKPTPVGDRERLSDGIEQSEVRSREGAIRSRERSPDDASGPMGRSRSDASPPMERPPANIQDR